MSPRSGPRPRVPMSRGGGRAASNVVTLRGMEAIEKPTTSAPVPREPVLLRVKDTPRPSITIGGTRCEECKGAGVLEDPVETCPRCGGSGMARDGKQPVQLIAAVEGLVVEMTGDGAYAVLTLSVDIADVDFELDKVVVSGADPLEGLTFEDLDAVIIGAGMGTSPGAKVLEYLRGRV